VERALSGGTPRVVLDLGCNTGEYSRLALRHAGHVVALDGDADSVEALYRAERGSTKLSPLVSDLHNPTPAQGWQLRERAALLDRLKGDFVLALALVHHLRISAGVPLADVIHFLLDRAPEGIIEWVDRDDSMVKQMLRLRPDVYPDYNWPTFESMLKTHARLLSVSGAEGATRRLCHFSRH
jgi:SAM-dependent methyltransferase